MTLPPFDLHPPRRILVVCTQRIGDVLLATPLARSLKRAWPQAELDFLAFKGTEGVLQGNPDISRILAFPQRTDWRGKLAQFRQLWRRYDLALATIATDRARLYARVGGRFRAGLMAPGEKGKGWLLDRSLPFDDLDTHTVTMGERLTELLGIAASYEVVPPAVAPGSLTSTLKRLASLAGAPYAVLHPFPKYAYKTWRFENWAELARRIEGLGLKIVLTGGPDADERAYCAGIAHQAEVLNLAGALSLAETAEIVARSRLYVGPDTAVTHIAAATGTPTVALFGPSNPVKWGPWPKGRQGPESPWQRVGSGRQGNVSLIQGRGECVPCLLEGCDRKLDSLSDCLQEIPVQAVMAAIAELEKAF
ncbi:MAG: glycosyltransferase family 9 protein [Rhodocyclaceae bacterium]|nr:glycosyltransferase family 9 protein [Rhodocyclaceae bacterium]